MDPTVQVAIVSVFATFVTTIGVVAVAVINRRGDSNQEDDPDVDLDVNDILSRLVSMAAENQRKEASIQKLRAQISECKRRTSFLEQFIEETKRGTPHEWKSRAPGDPGDSQQEPDLE